MTTRTVEVATVTVRGRVQSTYMNPKDGALWVRFMTETGQKALVVPGDRVAFSGLGAAKVGDEFAAEVTVNRFGDFGFAGPVV